jgi:hypothetical protein
MEDRENVFMSSDMYAAMQTGKPYKVYKKTILAKVFVQVLNPFDGKPEGILLQGNPLNNNEGCFVKLWSEKENQFFKRLNKKHLKNGYLVPYEVKKFMNKEQESDVVDYSSFTEDDIEGIVNSRFLALRAHLNKVDAEAHVIRLLTKAQELNKTSGIMNAIEARLAELQSFDTREEK